MSLSGRICVALIIAALFMAGCGQKNWRGMPIPGGFSPIEMSELPESLNGGATGLDQMEELSRTLPDVKIQAFHSKSKSFNDAWSVYKGNDKAEMAQKLPIPEVDNAGMAMFFFGEKDSQDLPEAMGMVVLVDVEGTRNILAVYMDKDSMMKAATMGAGGMFGGMGF